MNTSKPLLWHQGLFLQPHHLQYLDQYHQDFAMTLHRQTRPAFWGLVELDVDPDALQSGAFECRSLIAILPDGSFMRYPDNTNLVGRNFEAVWSDRRQPLTVYIALRRLRQKGGNMETLAVGQTPGDSRWIARPGGVEMEDQHQGGSVASVQPMEFSAGLLFGAEADSADDCILLPVARIAQQGKEYRLDEHYIPPCVHIGASRVLINQLLTLRNNLTGRARVLESYKNAAGGEQGGLSGSAINNRLALQVLARYIPALSHVLDGEPQHPFAIYGLLRQLAGELSTFSEKFDISTDMAEGGLNLPAYDHGELSSAFGAAVELIGSLLNELTIGPELLVSLRREEANKFVGVLDKEFFERRNSLYLQVRTREPASDWLEDFSRYSKLGAAGQVDVYARRSLPGVSLIHLQGKPIGVTGQPNCHYFMVEREGYEWGYVQDNGQLGLIWNRAPEDLALDFVLVRG